MLVLQFLHPEDISISNLSAADDTVLLETLLREISESVRAKSKKILTLNVGNSGTTMRFLIALLSVVPGSYVLTGDRRMLKRPVGILVEALRELGADIQFLNLHNYLPLFIKGRSLISREITVDASESSQHISALLLVSTIISSGLSISLNRQVISRPYILMTCKLLEMCGYPVIWQEELIRVFPGRPQEANIKVEIDWSSASFWFGMMALAEKGEIFFPELKRTGLQGDEVVAELFNQLGVIIRQNDKGIHLLKSIPEPGLIDWDFRNCPDLAVPGIMTCALLGRRAVFRGLESLRIKESDRIDSLRQELRKLNGDIIAEYSGIWRLVPARTKRKKIRINSHADHRIAMAMMMVAMKGIEVEITDPDVVSKSYPGFWRDLQQIGFIIK
jgi:3-phosphoshikimate 1-carboxyvinyltransferase